MQLSICFNGKKEFLLSIDFGIFGLNEMIEKIPLS